jgi:hypothetical protein
VCINDGAGFPFTIGDAGEVEDNESDSDEGLSICFNSAGCTAFFAVCVLLVVVSTALTAYHFYQRRKLNTEGSSTDDRRKHYSINKQAPKKDEEEESAMVYKIDSAGINTPSEASVRL